MKKNELHILHLYPRDMNIYGDNGNVLVLTQRAKKHNLTPIVHEYNQGDTWPKQIDIVVGGGGQDTGQAKIVDDLQAISPKLHQLAETHVPMLFVCGLYQLAGHEFVTLNGDTLPGIGLLDVATKGTKTRLIGNVVAHSPDFGTIVGYENHSGQTTLGDYATPLANVEKGAGNNAHDKHEGARQKNIIGTYLHGSLLPKNPAIADWLIETGAKLRTPNFSLKKFDDSLAQKARDIAMQRPR